jgi:hypothetical protein
MIKQIEKILNEETNKSKMYLDLINTNIKILKDIETKLQKVESVITKIENSNILEDSPEINQIYNTLRGLYSDIVNR